MIFGHRSLTPYEVDAYDVLPTELARRVRVYAITRLPGGFHGMTLGRRILLARPAADDGNSALLAHELVHVRQWYELGVVEFSVRYVGQFLRHLWATRRWHAAYALIGAEVEARAETQAWYQRRFPERRPV